MDDWSRLKPLFERALELVSGERAGFIRSVAADDEVLGHQLAALIEAHERTLSTRADILDSQPPVNTPGIAAVRVPSAPRRCFAEGETLLGRFEIVRFVADGGMGEVYEARDIQLGRVALKTVRSGMPGTATLLARFRREVQLSRRVTDTRVCRVHDLFTAPARDDSGPVNFLTMEYLEGITLAERIAKDGPVPAPEALEIALQLCSGIHAIHKAGVIHRDLKCRNVMLRTRAAGSKTEAVIMDLGLACDANPDAADAEITAPNAVMGTPGYMAPEQFRGSFAGPGADIYALGVVLYEMVTGERPFTAGNLLASAIQRAGKVPRPSSIRPGLPRCWDRVIGKCLEFDPQRRFASAEEVAAELSPPALRLPALRLGSRSRIAGAILAAVVIIVATVAIWRSRPYTRPLADAEHWYGIGLDALREGTFHKATQALARATALDPDFLLAHARLADAWAELDFAGRAKDEILKASALQSKGRVPALDAKYVDAVRSALTFDFAGSLKDYRNILKQLPAPEKPYGYVDLGRAYEKTDDIPNALASYRAAARLAREYPAPFVHIGVLEARLGHESEADAAFSRAEDLYRGASDLEGGGEVAYQRAYAASLAGNAKRSAELLDEALRTARAIGSPQLEIRTLLRMSTVAYLADRNAESAELAQRAIDLAREKGLDYWATDGQIRLGNAWLTDSAKAEPPLQQALRLARESQYPRLEAGANLSLASLRDLQDKPDESLAFARPALDYYLRAGFNVDAMNASLLVVRAERDKADYKAALPHAMRGLALAGRSEKAPNILLFEELTGSVLLDLERYAEALPHFQIALRLARDLNQSVANEKLYCAEALFRLGRYDESETMLDSIAAVTAKEPRIAIALDRIRAYTSASRLEFSAASRIARRRLASAAAMNPDTRAEFEILAGRAAMAAGDKAGAATWCKLAFADAAAAKDTETGARANLCRADAEIAARAPKDALPLAESALTFFTASGQTESLSFTMLTLARAYHDSGDKWREREFCAKCLDMLNGSEHNQGNPAAALYARRPDISSARAALLRLSRD